MSENPDATGWRGAEITVSDSRRGVDADDRSGDVIVARFALLPAAVVARASVPDDIEAIQAAARDFAAKADVVILTGGTGLGPRDVTPQALAPLLDYQVPGMAEVMRHQADYWNEETSRRLKTATRLASMLVWVVYAVFMVWAIFSIYGALGF